MRSAHALVLIPLILAACGGSPKPMKPEEVAGAWVKAMNAHDWNGACELSAPLPAGARMTCIELLQRAFSHSRSSMSLEGLYMSGKHGTFSVSRPPAGLTTLGLQRLHGRWRVHFEVQIIR
jgi:hypothetical protein